MPDMATQTDKQIDCYFYKFFSGFVRALIFIVISPMIAWYCISGKYNLISEHCGQTKIKNIPERILHTIFIDIPCLFVACTFNKNIQGTEHIRFIFMDEFGQI